MTHVQLHLRTIAFTCGRPRPGTQTNTGRSVDMARGIRVRDCSELFICVVENGNGSIKEAPRKTQKASLSLSSSIVQRDVHLGWNGEGQCSLLKLVRFAFGFAR